MRSIKLRLTLLYGAGFLAILLPIVAALVLARHKSLDDSRDRASALAADLVSRADRIRDQAFRAISTLNAVRPGDPCSEDHLKVMRELVIRWNLLVDVGYIENGRIVCSSFGRQNYFIGPYNYVGSKGYMNWVQVAHPLVTDSRLVITADKKTGFAALIHEGTVLNSATTDNKLSLGIIAISSKKEMVSTGPFDPAWWQPIGSAYETSFFDGSRVVAWKRSNFSDYGAYVAIPGSEIDHSWHRVLWILLPIGLAAAGVLSLVFVQLVRLQGKLSTALRFALKHRELLLVYQPIVDLQTGAWVGAEALLRWRRPNGKFISPDVFIPVAEKSHLIEQVTSRVIELLETEAAELLRARPGFFVSINLSAADIANPAISDRLRAAAAKMGVHTRCIHIEATERVFLDAGQTRRAVDTLRNQGHSVVIDDFGTGYSSLSYLTDLQLDGIKIDKCFVSTIGKEAVTSHVIAHIIEMAKSLGLKMVAEGIETTAQADYLRTHGAQFGQGWLFAKPMAMALLRKELALREAGGSGEAASANLL